MCICIVKGTVSSVQLAARDHCHCVLPYWISQAVVGGRGRRESNLTLGLGLNRVLVFVVDSSTGDIDERRVLNVYTLSVYRQTRYATPTPSARRSDTPTEACSLVQVVESSAYTAGLWSRSRRLGLETVSRRISVSSRSLH